MDVNDTVIIFDAMHIQKDTIAIIVDGKGDHIRDLKGNQSSPNSFAVLLFTDRNLERLKARRRLLFLHKSSVQLFTPAVYANSTISLHDRQHRCRRPGSYGRGGYLNYPRPS